MLQPGFYNMDCMDGMKQFPDKFFDLAIADPPYGGGAETINEPENISGGGYDMDRTARKIRRKV